MRGPGRINRIVTVVRGFLRHGVVLGEVPTHVLAALYDISDDRPGGCSRGELGASLCRPEIEIVGRAVRARTQATSSARSSTHRTPTQVAAPSWPAMAVATGRAGPMTVAAGGAGPGASTVIRQTLMSRPELISSTTPSAPRFSPPRVTITSLTLAAR